MPAIRQAFVLGAGLGTRLRPLTDELPKPLIPIFGKPLITFALDHLLALGVEKFAINTHRLPEKFAATFADGAYRGAPVRLLHEPVLLETGGGIKNAEPALRQEPFIVYSGDILSDIDLQPLLEEHFARGNDVTLALRQTGLAAAVALDEGRVVDIGGKLGHTGTHDFANVSIWNPSGFARIPAATKISFVPILRDWISAGGKVGGVVLDERQWFNIGNREQYLEVHRLIDASGWRPHYLAENSWPVRMATDVQLDPTADLRGFYSLGALSRIGAGAVIEDTVIWPGAQVTAGSHLQNCVVRANRSAEGMLRDIDV